ncbi:MAG: TrkH family potassium uptake protein [Nitrospinaceae bacterium]
MVLLSGLLLAPLGISLYYGTPSIPGYLGVPQAFALTLAGSLVSGMFLWRLLPSGIEKLRDREGFAIVAFSWVFVSLFGALPYLLTGVCPRFIDALFESMSGFTTTGASIFTDVESLPEAILFWRNMTQWIGGMGIIMLSLAIFPVLGMGSFRLFKAEIPGGATVDRVQPRLAETAKLLWKTYVLLTCMEALLLRLGGMNLFDAVCHSFSTLSTGGFSTYNNSIAAFNSLYIESVIVLFMFLSGVNFALHSQLVSKNFKGVFKNPELRFYFSMVVICVLLATWELIRTATEIEPSQAFRHSLFTIVSINTTTGFVTEDFERWPNFLRMLVLGIMMVGGCSGSTSGSLKAIRYIILYKITLRELLKLVHPQAIFHVKVGEKTIGPEDLTNVIALTFMFMGFTALSYILLSFMDVDLTAAASASLATFSNTGPGLGQVGPTGNYADIPMLGKLVVIACMLMGRLEIYSIVLLLLPLTWRK